MYISDVAVTAAAGAAAGGAAASTTTSVAADALVNAAVAAEAHLREFEYEVNQTRVLLNLVRQVKKMSYIVNQYKKIINERS